MSKPVCKLSSCDYGVPENYNPQYGVHMGDDTVNGANRAEAIFKNCLVLAFKESFYVGPQGELEGYSWFNFPGRIILWISNWFSGGKNNDETILKIEETFEFILGIRKAISCNEEDTVLRSTSFSYTIKYFCSYTFLAEKIIQKYPRSTHQRLYHLAHRILHERSIWIEVMRDGCMAKRRNIASEAGESPYERTTLWTSD
jgi:hypothetical protein